MKSSRFFAACIPLLLLLAISLSAQDVSPFTSSELDRFIRDWPRVREWAEERNLDAEVESPEELAYFLRGTDLERFIGSLGWETERFFSIAGRAAVGLMVAETQTQMPEVVLEMQRQRDEIRNNPDIPEAQKQEVLKQMDEAIAQMQDMDFAQEAEISSEELRLVQARRERLKEAFAWEE